MNNSISFVIPAFQAEGTIADAMRSVLVQQDARIELIVVDDGSTDATFARAAGLADGRTTLVRRTNRGVAASRNLGLLMARHEFVCFLDADDIVLPSFARSTLDAIDLNDAVSTAYRDTDAMLQPSAYVWRPDLIDLQLNRLRLQNPLAIGATVFRTDMLREVARHFGEAFPAHSHVEDWELLLSFTSLGAKWATPIPEPLMYCRLLPASRSAQSLSVWTDGLTLIDRWVPSSERASARRNWTISHLTRALADQQQAAVEHLLPTIGTPTIEDLPIIAGALRAWQRRHTAASHNRLSSPELIARLAPLGAALAGTVAADVALPTWEELMPLAVRGMQKHQRLVVYGFGRNGREAVRALNGLAVNYAIIDDDPAFRHPLAISPSDLTAADIVLITPDAEADIIERLKSFAGVHHTRHSITAASEQAA